jgi:hypothetical protein
MSKVRQGYLLRGVAIAIVAVFSGAWTFSVAGMGGLPTVGAADPGEPGGLPDGTSVPSEAIDAPASLSDAATIDDGNSAGVVAASSTNAIPSVALAAYQRAETVINKADSTCNLTWQLVAAIGRVESNHGRAGGNVLDSEGIATPGIFGPALNGTGGVQEISDTDAGQYDGDARWDRAVGPMQFIPATWAVVGVDADNDARRNPQDVDDSALAAAVYLCSGDDDLSTLTGQKTAVYRYNHSRDYVNLVIRIMDAYLDGDYTSVNGTTTAGGYVVPDPTYDPPPTGTAPRGQKAGASGGRGGDLAGGSDGAPTGDDNGSTGGDDGDDGGSTGGDGGDDGGNDGRSTTPGLTTGGGALDPDKDNVGDTGNKAVDKTTEALVDGILGLLKPVEVVVRCGAAKLWITNIGDRGFYQRCVDSYK